MFDFFGLLWNGFWQLLLNFLIAIHSVVGSAAVSIIIFTILMRMLTIPFTLKALRSSRNMQAVQPLVKEVQKKYGKDKAKQQEEMMKIYRDYGINPAAGCFPMLLQLPIFIGLFAALSFVLPTLGDVQQAWQTNQAQLPGFIWNTDWIGEGNASDLRESFGWVQNLGAADPLFIWPVLSGLFQFIQSRMAMPRRDPDNPMDPQQRMMNNIMQFMPIYIVFISAGFPAGTVIYWAFSSLFGAVLQYFITGFGSLPDLPGMGWLPRKEVVRPALRDPSIVETNAAKRKTGLMGRMMEKALEAQEAQRAAQGATAGAESETVGTGVTEVVTPASGSRPSKASAKTRGIVSKAIESSNGSANGSSGRTGNVFYASDKARELGNGAERGPASLPRKRKNKK